MKTKSEQSPVNGWIKLHRGIRGSWVWNNPNWLKWWLDLLLLAAWEDTVVRRRRRKVLVRRGEVCISNRELQRRWGVASNSTVQDFISSLIEEGMITRSFRKPQNGDHFSDQKTDQKGNHNTDHNSDHNGDHFFRVITICNYATYQALITTEPTTFATTSPTRKPTTPPTSIPTDLPGGINEEYKEVYIGGGGARVRTCEGADEGEADEDGEECFEERGEERSEGRETRPGEGGGGPAGADGARPGDEAAEDAEEVEREFRLRILSPAMEGLLETLCREEVVPRPLGREFFAYIAREWAMRNIKHKDEDDRMRHLASHFRLKAAAWRGRQDKGAATRRQAEREAAAAQGRQAVGDALRGLAEREAQRARVVPPENLYVDYDEV